MRVLSTFVGFYRICPVCKTALQSSLGRSTVFDGGTRNVDAKEIKAEAARIGYAIGWGPGSAGIALIERVLTQEHTISAMKGELIGLHLELEKVKAAGA
jgi:hypothetical protein